MSLIKVVIKVVDCRDKGEGQVILKMNSGVHNKEVTLHCEPGPCEEGVISALCGDLFSVPCSFEIHATQANFPSFASIGHGWGRYADQSKDHAVSWYWK